MKITDLFKWASASFALIPGIMVMLWNLGTPPGISAAFYGGLIEAAGSFTLILLHLNRVRIKHIGTARINSLSAFLFTCFIVLLLVYIFMFNTQVIYNPTYDTSIFFPFWKGNLLETLIESSGSKYNAISRYGPQAIQDAISAGGNYLEYTRLIFIIIYVLTFECIVLGFGFLSYKAAKK